MTFAAVETSIRDHWPINERLEELASKVKKRNIAGHKNENSLAEEQEIVWKSCFKCTNFRKSIFSILLCLINHRQKLRTIILKVFIHFSCWKMHVNYPKSRLFLVKSMFEITTSLSQYEPKMILHVFVDFFNEFSSMVWISYLILFFKFSMIAQTQRTNRFSDMPIKSGLTGSDLANVESTESGLLSLANRLEASRLSTVVQK